jgi:peptide-methionine (S)-S-oxide reductase
MVGYAGGTSKDPTYRNIGDHSETIQIQFDPNQIAYKDLLHVFWRSHSPTREQWSRQYMSIIFYHNEEQKRLAIETRDSLEAELQTKVFTEIVPATTFYQAENYHQKYYLQQIPKLAREYTSIYPDFNDFINSTAVARANGYAGGYGTADTLEDELKSLGLSPEGESIVLEIAEHGLISACPVP